MRLKGCFQEREPIHPHRGGPGIADRTKRPQPAQIVRKRAAAGRHRDATRQIGFGHPFGVGGNQLLQNLLPRIGHTAEPGKI